MNRKTIIIILLALGIITCPVKIVMEIMNPGSVRSMMFAIIFAVCVFLMSIFSSGLAKYDNKEYSFKNPILAIFSGLSAAALLAYSAVLFNSSAPSDASFQYFGLSCCSVLSALFFGGVSYSHMTGKNFFRKLHFMLFFPIVMYVISLTLFFSFELDDPNAYNILSQALMLMFFVYYSNFYVKYSNKNYVKRCFAFGVPATLVSLCYSAPMLARDITNSTNCISSLTPIALSVYVFLFLMSRIKSIFEPEKVDLV